MKIKVTLPVQKNIAFEVEGRNVVMARIAPDKQSLKCRLRRPAAGDSSEILVEKVTKMVKICFWRRLAAVRFT